MSNSSSVPWSATGLRLVLPPRGRALLSGVAVSSGAAAIAIIALAPASVAFAAGVLVAILWCRWLDAVSEER